MQNRCSCLLRFEILSQMIEELRALISVRMYAFIVLPYNLPGDVLATQLLNKVRQKTKELLHPFIGICRIAGMHSLVKNWVIQLQQALNT